MTKYLSLLILFSLFQKISFAQANPSADVKLDSANLKLIRITHTDSLRKYEDKNYVSFLGAVVIEHDDIVMTCDSAHLFIENNFVEAYENVRITKSNGTSAQANYIKYTGDNNTAFMQGAVQIIDGVNTLNTEELVYNIKTKVGKYYKSGTLHNEETTVSSETGTYNGYSQQAYFKKNVVVTNPKYAIESDELTYNMKTKVLRFLAPSTITTDNTTIQTKLGTYDTKREVANFDSRTRIENEEQIIEGNTIAYNGASGKAVAKGNVVVVDLKESTELRAAYAEYSKKSGYGKATGNVVIVDTKNDSRLECELTEYNKLSGDAMAKGNVYLEQEGGKSVLTSKQLDYNKKTGYTKASGNVVIIDTVEKSKLLANNVEFNEFSKFMLATQNPKLITLADDDSLYIRADTLMSIKEKEYASLKWIEILSKTKEKKSRVYNLLMLDSTYIDDEEEAKKIIIGHVNVRIYSDSMQAVCDSLSYSQSDSMFRMYKSPVLWSKNQQASADTIYLRTKSRKLEQLNLLYNALLVSEIGYESYYDQISGAYINAYFKDNNIEQAHIEQNAETLYYAKDDSNKYLGTNISESASMKIYFSEKELSRISMLNAPKGKFHPIDTLTDAQKYLSTFKLYTSRKPLSKLDILSN